LARTAVEHRTTSGSMPARFICSAMARAAPRPRLASGRSWSSRPMSLQLDFAWRSKWRVFIDWHRGSCHWWGVVVCHR
jgi:hypothetical protein